MTRPDGRPPAWTPTAQVDREDWCRGRCRDTHAGYVVVALGWYLLAKVLEVGSVDHGVYDAGQLVRAYTLKHLAAAAGASWLFLLVKYRRPAATAG